MSNTEPGSLADLLKTWINTETWNESHEFLKAHADQLLRDETLATLDTMLKDHEGGEGEHAGDAQYVEVLQQHRKILEVASASSIDEAYQDLLRNIATEDLNAALNALVETKSPAEVLEQAQQHPILLSPEGFAAIDKLLEALHQDGQEETARLIEERYETLKQIKADLEAMNEPVSSDLLQLIQDWINTDTWEQSRAMLEAHAEQLLSDEALRAVNQLLAMMAGEDEKAEQTLLRHRAILEKARAESINAAYEELLRPSPINEALNALLNADYSGPKSQVQKSAFVKIQFPPFR